MIEMTETQWNRIHRFNERAASAGPGDTRYRAGVRELCRNNPLTGELEWIPVRIRPPSDGGPRPMDWGMWLAVGCEEWHRAWGIVTEKYGDPLPSDLELWQYMGTVRTETLTGAPRLYHEFRRRGWSTPEGKEIPRCLEWVPASPGWYEENVPPEVWKADAEPYNLNV